MLPGMPTCGTMEDVKGTGRSIASNAAVDLGLPADQVKQLLDAKLRGEADAFGRSTTADQLGSVHGRGLADELRSKERVSQWACLHLV